MGTGDPAAYLSVPAAIAFQREHHWDTVRQACHKLAAYARQQMMSIFGTEPICPDGPQWWGQMCAIPVPDGDAPTLHSHLRDAWRIEIPVTTWENQRFIRLSIQGYNSLADVERLLTAIRAIFRQGETAAAS